MIKFGVSGNSQSFYDEGHTATAEAAKWCYDRGIDSFEYSFGRGLNLSEETARAIGVNFKQYNIEMSVHSPYFINFSNTDADMISKSIGYVMGSICRCKAFGGSRVVVHPASRGKLTREEAVDTAYNNLISLKEAVINAGYNDIKICLETMGKTGQIGTVDEIIKFCSIADFFYPCVDFGHVNAREQGILNKPENYNTLLQNMLDHMPRYKVDEMHVHFSKIQFGAKGEIKHLNFDDKEFGPDFEPLAKYLLIHDLHPFIICESENMQAEDALYMKTKYYEIKNAASILQ